MKRTRQRRSVRSQGLPVLPRIFAILAAVLLVGSVALAALLPADISLYQAMHGFSPRAAEHLQHAIKGALGHGAWDVMVVPVLIRPVWLMPVCLGLICIGGAVTALSRVPPRSNHRRS